MLRTIGLRMGLTYQYAAYFAAWCVCSAAMFGLASVLAFSEYMIQVRPHIWISINGTDTSILQDIRETETSSGGAGGLVLLHHVRDYATTRSFVVGRLSKPDLADRFFAVRVLPVNPAGEDPSDFKTLEDLNMFLDRQGESQVGLTSLVLPTWRHADWHTVRKEFFVTATIASLAMLAFLAFVGRRRFAQQTNMRRA